MVRLGQNKERRLKGLSLPWGRKQNCRGKGYLEIREGVLKFRAFPRKEAEGKGWT